MKKGADGCCTRGQTKCKGYAPGGEVKKRLDKAAADAYEYQTSTDKKAYTDKRRKAIDAESKKSATSNKSSRATHTRKDYKDLMSNKACGGKVHKKKK